MASMERRWGSYVRLCLNDRIELRRLSILAGGFCSQHWHDTKSNLFIVESGALRVKLLESQTEVLLGPGEAVTVASGLLHQFAADADSVVYELAIAKAGEMMDVDEIHRLTESGRREPEDAAKR